MEDFHPDFPGQLIEIIFLHIVHCKNPLVHFILGDISLDHCLSVFKVLIDFLLSESDVVRILGVSAEEVC